MRTTFTEATRLVPDIISLSTAVQLDDEQRAALIAKRFEALSHPTRLRALRILAAAPEQTVNINALVDMLASATQGTVSRHVQCLVFAGFLECVESRGRGIDVRHYYRVKKQAISDALTDLLSYTRIGEVAAPAG